ncbi:TOMM precursor leader peptide-binding protein [Streptomyces sp. NPDC056773]|uniref:TOMM precursor leader peptide-binding protein n=1 Tax=unclassified Streptomyces TaxID=2593676 RepID=UPI00369BF0D9
MAFKRHVRAETVPGEAVFLLSDKGVTTLRGAGIEALVPLLDGSRTLSQLLQEASAAMPVAEVGRVVRRLAQANLVGYRQGPEAVSDTCVSAQAYWDRAGLDGSAAAAEVSRVPIAVIPVGGVDPQAAYTACRASGLNPVDEYADAPFALVLCADYSAPELPVLAARLRRQGRAWLLARPFGAEPWTGPVFDPRGAGACWSCLEHRLGEHRRSEVAVQRALGLDGPAPRPAPSLAAVGSLGMQSAVLEASKWIAGLRYEEQHAVCVLDSLTLRTTHHPVQRRPQCPSCGDPSVVASRASRPVELKSRLKSADGGTNDRALSVSQMLHRHRQLIGPVTGIVTDIRPLAGLPEGLHAYDSGHNLALRGHSLAGARQVLRARSGGKGVTANEARVSALCEAVERYSGSRQGDEPVVLDSLAGLGAEAVHPNGYLLFDERQYADRDRWNARQAPSHHVSRPFDPAAPTEWSPVWSLTSRTRLLLPTSTLYFDASPGGSRDGLWADSNGNAAGSSVEDAVVQGFLELVERDAVALWWYNRLRMPALDLGSFDEPWLVFMREALDRAGREVWALDLTSDLGVPVVVAVSRAAADAGGGHVYGFGAHFDPRLALRRAMTEMVQMLPPSGPSSAPPSPRAAREQVCGEEQPQLLPDAAQSPRTPRSWPYAGRNEDLLDDIEQIKSLVAGHGMELLVLDQTRPDTGIPVVKVLVPGMRPFYARFAPGRLYDVPVRLGHLRRPHSFDELNPIPLPA